MQRLSEYTEYIKYREGYLEGMESLYVVGRCLYGDVDIRFDKVWATSEQEAISKAMGLSIAELEKCDDIVVPAVKI